MRHLWMTVLLVSTLTGSAAADEASAARPHQRQPADKFMRGLTNLITAPLEIPRHIRKHARGGNTFRHWSTGTAQGLGYTVVRFAAGAYEVLTFPADAPKDFAPVLQPEYVWQEERTP